MTATFVCGGPWLPEGIPDLSSDDDPCCEGRALDGPRGCTCWIEAFSPRVQAPVVEGLPQIPDPVVPCSDCAYKAGSPEKRGDPAMMADAEKLEDLAAAGLGSVPGVVEIPLRDRHKAVVGYARVDLGDARHATRRWHLGKNGYVVRTERITPGRDGKRRTYYLHREVLGLGPGDPGVDHEDGDPTNCCRYNLRVGRQALNLQNRGPNSGRELARGVSFDTARGKWQAAVKINGTQHYLGRFDAPEQAAAAASAFRASNMPWSPDARELAAATPFFCHAGIRYLIGYVHLPCDRPGCKGATFAPARGDYRPPQRGGVPYQADGQPGYLCAGWLLRRAILARQGVIGDAAAEGR